MYLLLLLSKEVKVRFKVFSELKVKPYLVVSNSILTQQLQFTSSTCSSTIHFFTPVISDLSVWVRVSDNGAHKGNSSCWAKTQNVEVCESQSHGWTSMGKGVLILCWWMFLDWTQLPVIISCWFFLQSLYPSRGYQNIDRSTHWIRLLL